MLPLDKTPPLVYQNPTLFGMNWPIWPNPGNPKALHMWGVDLKRDVPQVLQLSLLVSYLDLSLWALKTCLVLLLGPVSNKLLSCNSPVVFAEPSGSPSDIPGRY